MIRKVTFGYRNFKLLILENIEINDDNFSKYKTELTEIKGYNYSFIRYFLVNQNDKIIKSTQKLLTYKQFCELFPTEQIFYINTFVGKQVLYLDENLKVFAENYDDSFSTIKIPQCALSLSLKHRFFIY